MEILEEKDVTNDFIFYIKNGLIDTDILKIKELFIEHNKNNRLVLFFDNWRSLKTNINDIKSIVEDTVLKYLKEYILKPNVDILDKNIKLFKLFNITLLGNYGIDCEKNSKGKIHFVQYTHSCIQFCICLESMMTVKILNHEYVLRKGDMIFFPSSWVFPYNYYLKSDTIYAEGFVGL